MLRFLLIRLAQIPIVIAVVSLIVFVFLNASGDPVQLLLPVEASQEDIAQMREALGLDRPLLIRYWEFLVNAVRGDFGMSLRARRPAIDIVLEALPATLELAGAALLIATAISLPLGIMAAVRRNGFIDAAATVISVLGQSMPVFWLGIIMIMVFSVQLGWLPASGRGHWTALIMPAVALGWYMNALMARMTRASMLEVLGQPYIRTARAKGLPEHMVVLKHAFGNARIPIVTIWGLQAGAMLTGTVITETVFSWPGIGRASIYALQGRDYPVVLAAIAVFTVMFLIINLVVDLIYFLLDPRIRRS
ncbi:MULTISPECIES: ABC transporter permease [unclassified Roseitalea]|uniref:ABC transporter permease n=1 Tax=unclassified Roseitalea TaxID=2639107 RepID=UPI00273D3CF8|nr:MULTISPECIES: ABC transporter permease [unclassified Roseitalea]